MRRGLFSIVLLLVSASVTYAQTYCAAGPSSTADSDIRDVVLSGDNYGISKLNTCPGIAGVANYTATDSADLSLGNSYSLQVVFSSCSGNYYNGVGHAWIDFNDDGTFDASEALGTGVSFTNAQQPYTANFAFSVPAGASLGETRMRVMQYEGGTLPLSACAAYTWGAVEDYRIRITGTPPACPTPSGLNATAITSNGATLNWSAFSGNTFNVEYGPNGFTPGTGTLLTGVTGTSTVVTGLSASSTYQFYVQNDCVGSGNGTSAWSVAGSFTTLCGTVSTPYTHDFENIFVGWQSQFANCWDSRPGATSTSFRWESENSTGANENSLDTGPWYDNTTPSTSGGIYMYLETSSGTTGDTATLVSPPIDLTGLTTPFVQFYYHMYGATMGTLEVLVQGTSGVWTPVWSLSGQQQSAGSDPFNLDGAVISSFAGQVVRVKFRGQRGTSFTGDMSIDDFSVGEAPTCPWVSNISAFDVTGTTASLAWNSNGTNFTVEWGPCGFAQGTGSSALASNDTVAITGLAPNTCYHVYVQNNCGVNGTSIWTGPYSFTTAIVPDWLEEFPTYIPSRWLEAQGNLSPTTTFTSINPTASGWFQDGWLNNGFTGAVGCYVSGTATDEWVITPPIDLGTGNSYQLEYDLGLTANGSTNPGTMSSDDSVMVVISLDGGATWSRANVLKQYSTANPIGNAGVHDVVDLTGYSGVVKFGFYVESTVTNTIFDLFLDNVEVRTPPPCPEPFGIILDSVGTTWAALHWNAAGNYNIEWGPAGYGQGTGTFTTVTNDSNLYATGLMAATTYDFYVQTDCGSGVYSAWTGPFQVTTLCDTFALPYSYGFENSVVIPNKPTCWDWTNGTSYWQTNTGVQSFNRAPRTGNNYLQVRWTSSTNQYAFTPEFHLQANTSYEFSFWYNTDGYAGWEEISAWFGTAQDQASMTYQIGSPVVNPNNTTYMQFTGTFIPPATGNYYLGIKARSDGAPWYVTFDDLMLQLDPNPCASPASITTSLLIDTAATITWSSLPSINTFNLEWGPQGFTQGSLSTGTVINGINGLSYTLDTLQGNTCYDVYVQGICGAGNTPWVGPFTFCTPCSPNTAPYLDNFDSYLLYDVPDCYAEVIDNFAYVQVYNFPAGNSAPNQIQIYNSGNTGTQWSALVTPMFSDMPAGDKRVKFDVRTSSAANSIIVGTVPSQTSTTGFDALDTITGLSTGTWQTAIVELTTANGYNGTDQFIVFKHGNEVTYSSVYIDNLYYDFIPTCPEPLYGVTSLITANSAVAGWTATGSAPHSQVAYGPAATTTAPLAGTIITVAGVTQATMSGLTDNTDYVWWVRDSCAAGDASIWSGPFTFKTLCVPFTMPYFENFTAWPPNCTDIAVGSNPWLQQSGWANANYWGILAGGTVVMELPAVILSDPAVIKFKWSHLYNSFYPQDAMTLRVREISSPTWDTIWHLTGSAFNSSDGAGSTTPGSGVPESFPLSMFALGDTLIAQFYGYSGFGPNAYIDDVEISEVPNCPAPYALGASAITDTSANLTWSDSIGATTWYVEYGPPGFQVGSGTIISTTTTSLSLTGLPNNTGYCYYVSSQCPGGTDTSGIAGPYCFTTACGVVTGDVLANPYMVTSMPYTHSGNTSVCYTNTAFNPSNDVYYQLTTSAGATDITASLCVGTTYDSYLRILDATGSELLSNDDACGVQSEIANFPVTPGTVYYVVVEGYTSNNGAYTLNITENGTPTCGDPTGVMATTVDCDLATIDWTQGGDASTIEYGPVGFTPGTGTVVTGLTPPYTITGLTSGASYDVYVQDTCNGLGVSAWVGPVTFTTLSSNAVASFVPTMTGSTASSMTFSFDASGSTNALSYSWDFGNGTTGSGVNPSVTYLSNGMYSVTLTVTGTCGTDDTTIVVNANIGVEEELGLEGLSLFPNPTSGVFNLEVVVSDRQDVHIQLFNMIGEEVRSESLTGYLGTYRTQFDLSAEAKGIYLVRIETEGGSIVRRIALQ